MTENDQINEIVFFLIASAYALLGAGGAYVLYQAAAGKAKLSWRLGLSNWQRPTLLLALLLEFCCLLYSFYEPYTLEISHLPLGGQKVNLKIVHLSDAHFDDIDRGEAQILAAVKGTKPDLIVFTGDAANSKAGLMRFALFIKALSAIAPTFAVSGNHDRLSRQFFADNGARLIDDETVKFQTDKVQANLVGLNLDRERHKEARAQTQIQEQMQIQARAQIQWSSKNEDAGTSPNGKLPNKSSGNAESKPLLLALSHYPACYRLAADQKADLFLCGHTHGGQVTLSPLKLFARGYYSGSPPSYVSRGLGMFGLPIRFLCPPEITVIELQTN